MTIATFGAMLGGSSFGDFSWEVVDCFEAGWGSSKFCLVFLLKGLHIRKKGPLVLGNGGIYMNAGSGNITSIYLRPSLEIQRSADEMTFLPEERASTMGTESPLEGKHPSVSRARVGTAFLICTTNPHTTHPSLLFIN